MGLTTHSRERRVLAVLVLLVFARLAGTAAAAAGAADSYYTTDHSLDDGSQVSQMNPPVILDDDPATPVTYVWPETEGTPWPLSDYNEDAELLVEADYEGEPHIAASHRRKLADHKDLLSDIKGTFRDVGDSLSDAFNEVEEFVKGVGRGARREVLQVPEAPAPAPAPPAAPATPPVAPPTTPAAPPATTPAAPPTTTTTPAAPPTPTTTPPTTTTPPPTTTTPPPATTTTPTPPATTTPTPTPKPTTPTTTQPTTTTGGVTTKPAAEPNVAVTPTDIQAGENVPAAVQQQQDAANQAAAQQTVQASVPADIVSVAFTASATTPEQFSASYLPTVLSTLAQLTGTPADQWKATITEKTATSSNRALLQQQQQQDTTSVASGTADTAVSLSILTRNPQLVVYRLAQSPTSATAGCSTELCARLLAAGVPVLPGSVAISPDFSSVFQFGAPAASAVDAQLAAARRTGAIVGAVVGGAVFLIILLFTYKKLFNCVRGQVASLKAKKTAPSASKQSPPTAKTNEETPAKQNPNSNDHNKAQTATISANTINANNSPVADLPVKFLSLSSSQGIAADAPVVVANHHHPTAAATALGTTNNRMWKQNSGSSSGIPVGPITGHSNGGGHSITPWAELDESPRRLRDQYNFNGSSGGGVVMLPQPPTAAGLAAAAAAQQQQGALYRDSNSFRQWVAASAVMMDTTHGTPTNTPTSSAGSAALYNHNSSSTKGRYPYFFDDNNPRPISPATAADLAAAMPNSPISSPMIANAPSNMESSSKFVSPSAARRFFIADGGSVRRTPTPVPGSSPRSGGGAGGGLPTATTVDVVQLQQMLDAHYLEQQHQKTGRTMSGVGGVASARAASVSGAGGHGGGRILQMRAASVAAGGVPASPVGAAGWSSSVGGAASRRLSYSTNSNRRMSAPGTPTAASTAPAGLAFVPMRS